MIRIATKMLAGDTLKYAGLVLGIAFTAFLVTFAASYFCGMLTRGFALIAENPTADVWVMDPGVLSTEQTINLPSWSLERIRSVEGVAEATPLLLASSEARLPGGGFVPVQIIGVDDATLIGFPGAPNHEITEALRKDKSVFADAGGTEGKLQVPLDRADWWIKGPPRLHRPSREIAPGDELHVNDFALRVVGVSNTLPRFPPRPLLYMTRSRALATLPLQREQTTFVLVRAAPGVAPRELARRITNQTGLKALSGDDFRASTVLWYLENSEDVGDVIAMLSIALCVGAGSTGVLLFLFTLENHKGYALMAAMGASRNLLLRLVLAQAGLAAIVGAGIGIGLCALAGQLVAAEDLPFRMMWFTPILGAAAVLVTSLLAATVSLIPVLRLQPAEVFASR